MSDQRDLAFPIRALRAATIAGIGITLPILTLVSMVALNSSIPNPSSEIQSAVTLWTRVVVVTTYTATGWAIVELVGVRRVSRVIRDVYWRLKLAILGWVRRRVPAIAGGGDE